METGNISEIIAQYYTLTLWQTEDMVLQSRGEVRMVSRGTLWCVQMACLGHPEVKNHSWRRTFLTLEEATALYERVRPIVMTCAIFGEPNWDEVLNDNVV